ncbi:MAG: hypothetical protein ABWX74_04170 [Aeromicrobium sp.]
MTRLAVDPRWTARAVLLVCVGLALWAALSPAAHQTLGTTDDDTDVGLYKAITARMADGAGYYQAVAAEQPQRGYPLSPAPAVREPTLAWFNAVVGPSASYVCLLLLTAAAAVVSVRCMDRWRMSRIEWLAASTLVVLNVVLWCVPSSTWSHDVWAGLLLLLALMARASGHWRTSVAAVVLAASVRELAAPVIVLAAVVAWREGRRNESLAWVVGGALFALYYAWHVVNVVGLPDAPGGSGWLAAGGWPFSTEAIRFSSLLRLGPGWLAALLVPCALLGWSVVRPRAPLALATIVAYLAVFMLVGRSNNAYWGALVAPLLVLGLALAPRGLAHWARAAVRHPASVE